MSKDRTLVSFDWAAKQLLRNKANFEVVEGFLSELFGRDIKITNVLESESNKTDPDDKFDRVDVVVEDEQKEVLLIEIQFSTDPNYFLRMLYGVSKAITDRMYSGDKYDKIKKVYSINIVYFDLGQGNDCIYHGKTLFRGARTQEIMELEYDQRMIYDKVEPGDLYPEYYVLKVKNFNDITETTLDEWLYFLKNTRIKDNFRAKGLLRAREILDYSQLSQEDKVTYDYILESRTRHREQIDNAIIKGIVKGMEQGRQEGIAEGRQEGIAEGRQEGIAEGRQKGIAETEEKYVKILEEKDKESAEKDKEKAERDKENAELKERLAKLELLLRDKQIE
jgi:predicted transposase/invertase (TIGR01784 family)